MTDQLFNCRPSSATRWFNCGGSAFLSALPGSGTVKNEQPAVRGTVAHSVLEECVKDGTKSPYEFIDDVFDQEGFEIIFNKEDADAVNRASVDIKQAYAEASSKHEAFLHVESEVSFVFGGVTIEGRPDYVIACPHYIDVIDYKHGTWDVRAYGNEQLLLYLEAMIQKYGERPGYRITILQPRGYQPQDIWRFSHEEYVVHKKRLLRAVADISYAELVLRTDGSFIPGIWRPGRHCAFCPGKGECPGFAEEVARVAILSNTEYTNPALLTRLVAGKEALGSVTSKAADAAYSRMMAGESIRGLKLIGTKGKRAWKKDLTKEQMYELSDCGLTKEVPITIGAAEKKSKDEEITLDEYLTPGKSGYKVVTEDSPGKPVIPVDHWFDKETDDE